MREKTEPLILCEFCHSFAVSVGLKPIMDKHRQECDGKPGDLLIRKSEERKVKVNAQNRGQTNYV